MTAVASLTIQVTPALQYLLRIADTCLIHAQRMAEWCGHGPVLEEDIALTNMSLDLLGQARALLSHTATLHGQGLDEDQLAFLREERQFYSLTLVEQPSRRTSAHAPGGDFADLVLRNYLLATWLQLLWAALMLSTDKEVAAIAGKAVKEARYHQQHAHDWVQRLGDGTPESRARMQAALAKIWQYTNEMFLSDDVDAAALATGLGPDRRSLQAPWLEEVSCALCEATLSVPAATEFVSTGSLGIHSEHMGFILAEMQHLQRAFPGGRW